MATPGTRPVAPPANRFVDLPAPQEQSDHPGPARVAPICLRAVGPEERAVGAPVWLLLAPLVLLAVPLWPVLFVALVLVLVGVTLPVVVLRALAALGRGRRAAA